MKTEFTLKQLKFANEVCFGDDFIKLFNKYAVNDSCLNNMGNFYLRDIRAMHGNNLLTWIFHWSRADLDNGFGDIIHGILTELIGDYV